MDRLIRINEVMNITGKSRSSIYSDIASGSFPDSIKIGARSVAWNESAISGWIKSKIDAGKSKPAAFEIPTNIQLTHISASNLPKPKHIKISNFADPDKYHDACEEYNWKLAQAHNEAVDKLNFVPNS
jgi:prophage regulatory protein